MKAPYFIYNFFESIQGEGIHIGMPALFIRFCGCNLACPWCDTKYAWSYEECVEYTADEIVNIIKTSKKNLVVLTGGEPTLYNLDPFLETNKTVDIETNATRIPKVKQSKLDYENIYWILSPKVSKAYKKVDVGVIMYYLKKARNVVIKLVVDDIIYASEVTRKILEIRKVPIIWQPLARSVFRYTEEDIESLKRLVEYTVEHNLDIRVLPQLHKIVEVP